MKEIPLTQGKVALVDDADYAELSRYRWCFNGVQYAMRQIKGENGKYTPVKMHRVIMAAPAGMEVDHINGNGLDNRRINLRVCTKQQNGHNRTTRQTNNTSGFKGVCADRKNFRAYIRFNGKTIHIGTYRTASDAARAYNLRALELFGEFARLNVL